jgi:hypothetical protein
MQGPVVICDTEIYRRIVKTLGPVMLSAQDAVKVSVPPLPRYIFSPCCQNPRHCTNLNTEGAAEKLLNGVSGLRNLLKAECKKMNIQNHWILDGIGTLAGVPVGQTAGSNKELLPELKDAVADDGVHLTTDGYRKLAQSIISAIDGIRSGSLTKSLARNVSGPASTGRDFFWRGFVSPVGDAAGRAAMSKYPHRCKGNWNQRHHHQYHPYQKKK